MIDLGIGHWMPVKDGDARALALFKRHYSYRRRAKGQLRGSPTFVGQGEKMVLLTLKADALYTWQRSVIPRMDGEAGIRCTIFRNESSVLSSELIREACELAWRRWPGERLYTYVNGKKVKSANPGYCFKAAGWRFAGMNKDRRLIILELLP